MLSGSPSHLGPYRLIRRIGDGGMGGRVSGGGHANGANATGGYQIDAHRS